MSDINVDAKAMPITLKEIQKNKGVCYEQSDENSIKKRCLIIIEENNHYTSNKTVHIQLLIKL